MLYCAKFGGEMEEQQYVVTVMVEHQDRVFQKVRYYRFHATDMPTLEAALCLYELLKQQIPKS